MKVKQVEDYAINEFKKKDMIWFIDLHLKPMKEIAFELAEKLDADKTVIELAVWLHDITHVIGIKKIPHDHPKVNSDFAEKFLKENGFDENTIKNVCHCILNHGCQDGRIPKTLEGKIIASADAMAHIKNFEMLLFAGFYLNKYDNKEVYNWLKAKISRDWKQKIMLPEAKEMIKERYHEIEILLENMEKHMGP
ncbi:MAG: HD domain-containing protein [Candidatus Aenigmatarchaeota archaeon]